MNIGKRYGNIKKAVIRHKKPPYTIHDNEMYQYMEVF